MSSMPVRASRAGCSGGLLVLLAALATATAPGAARAQEPGPAGLGDLAPAGAPDGQLDTADLLRALDLVLQGSAPGDPAVLDEDSLLRGDLAPAVALPPDGAAPLLLAPPALPLAPLDLGDAVLLARLLAGQVRFGARNAAPLVELDPVSPLLTASPAALTGRVQDDGDPGAAQVELLLDGAPLAPWLQPDAQGAFAGTVPLHEGAQWLAARARDEHGRWGPPCAAQELRLDTVAPWIVLAAPAPEQRVAAAEVELRGEVRDEGGVAAVWVGGAEALLLGDGFGATVALEPGLNRIEVVALDLAGNRSEPLEVVVVRDETPPTVTLTPLASPTRQQTVLLAGEARDEWGLAGIRVGDLAAVPDPETGRFALEVPVAEGPNRFVAVAEDLAGNTASSAPLTLVGDFHAPGLTLVSSPCVARSPAQIELAFDEPAQLLAFGDLALAPAPPSAGRTLDAVALQPGLNRLAWRLQDLAGNEAEGTLDLTLDAQAPLLQILRLWSDEPAAVFLPPDGLDGVRTTAGLVSLEGTVSDDFALAGVWIQGRSAALDPLRGTFRIDGLRLSPLAAENVIEVLASDRAGNQVSELLHVWVDITGPSGSLSPIDEQPFVSLDGPVAGALDGAAGLWVQGQAADPAGLDGLPLAWAEGTALEVQGSPEDFRFFLDPTLLSKVAGGKLDVELRLRDGLGNEATVLRPVLVGAFSPLGQPVPGALGAALGPQGMGLLERQIAGQLESMAPQDLGGSSSSFSILGLTVTVDVQAVALCRPSGADLAQAARADRYDCANDAQVSLALEPAGLRVHMELPDLFVDLQTQRGYSLLCLFADTSGGTYDGYVSSAPATIDTLARFQVGPGGLELVAVPGSTQVELGGFVHTFDDPCLRRLEGIGSVFGLSIQSELESGFEEQMDAILASLGEQLAEPLVETNGVALVIADAVQDEQHLEFWLEARGDPCGPAGCGDPSPVPGLLLGRSAQHGRVALPAEDAQGQALPLQVGLDDSFLNLLFLSEWLRGRFDLAIDSSLLGGGFSLDTSTLALLLPELARPDLAAQLPPGRAVLVVASAQLPPLAWARPPAQAAGGLDLLLADLELTFLADLDPEPDGAAESLLATLRVSATGRAGLDLYALDLAAQPPRGSDELSLQVEPLLRGAPDPRSDTLRMAVLANPWVIPEASLFTLVERLLGLALPALANQSIQLPGSLVRFDGLGHLGEDGRMLVLSGRTLHEVLLEQPLLGTVSDDPGLPVRGLVRGLAVAEGQSQASCQVLLDLVPQPCSLLPVAGSPGSAEFVSAGHDLSSGDHEVLVLVDDALAQGERAYVRGSLLVDPAAGGTFPPTTAPSCFGCAAAGDGPGRGAAQLLGLFVLLGLLGLRRHGQARGGAPRRLGSLTLSLLLVAAGVASCGPESPLAQLPQGDLGAPDLGASDLGSPAADQGSPAADLASEPQDEGAPAADLGPQTDDQGPGAPDLGPGDEDQGAGTEDLGGADRQAPTLRLDGPASPAARPLLRIDGEVQDDRGLEGLELTVELVGVPGSVVAAQPEPSGRFSLELRFAPGDYSLRALARDRAGNEAEVLRALQVVDTLPPSVELLEPGYEVAGSPQDFLLRVEDDFGVLAVELDLPRGGAVPWVATQDPADPSLWRARADLLPGLNPLRLRALDLGGNEAQVEGELLWRDDVPPALSLDAPAEGATLWAAELRVEGRATDDVGLAAVEVLLDGQPLPGTPFLPEAADGSFALAAEVAPGRHTLDLSARDLAGNASALPLRHFERRDPDEPARLSLELEPQLLLLEPGARVRVTLRAERAAGGPVADGTRIQLQVAPAGLLLPEVAELPTLDGVATVDLLPSGLPGTATLAAQLAGLSQEALLPILQPSQVEATLCLAAATPVWGLAFSLALRPEAALELAPAGSPALVEPLLPGWQARNSGDLPPRFAAVSATPAQGPGPLLRAVLPLAAGAAAGPEDLQVQELGRVEDGLGAVLPPDPAGAPLWVCELRNVAGDLPPLVSLERPPARVEVAELTVRGQVQDAQPDALVAVLRHAGQEQPLALDPAGRFEAPLVLLPGLNRVEALAWDAAGQQGSDAFEVWLALPDQAPRVELSAPPAWVASPEAQVEGRVSDDGPVAALRVELQVNQEPPEPLVLDEQGAFARSVALALGPNTLVVRAWDAAGQLGLERRSVERVEDGGPPSVVILEPLDGAQVERLPVDLQAQVSGGATRDVTALAWIDEQPVEVRYSPFSRRVTGRLDLEPGERRLRLQVTDLLGRSAEAALTLRYLPPDAAPELRLDRPRADARVAARAISVVGAVADDLGLDGLRVEASLDGGPAQALALAADGGFAARLPAALGPHTLRVTAIDSTGHRTSLERALELVAPPVILLSDLRIGGANDGFDLDRSGPGLGDPEPDNALSALAGLANPLLTQALDAGTLILLLEVNGLEELPGPGEEQEVELTFYQGVDLDGDPSDNRSGEEVFAIDPASLDAAGRPLLRFEGVRLQGDAQGASCDTHADGRPNAFSLAVPGEPPVELSIEPAYLRASFQGALPDLHLAGRDGPEGDLALLGGVVPACALATPLPVGGMEIVPLQLLVGSVDVDLNGDGLLDRATTVCNEQARNPDGLSLGLLARGLPARLQAEVQP